MCLYKIVSTATRDDVQVFTKKHVSAPFVLTRTHPCPTFDICGHVWAESFYYFNHYEVQWDVLSCIQTHPSMW